MLWSERLLQWYKKVNHVLNLKTIKGEISCKYIQYISDFVEFSCYWIQPTCLKKGDK